MTGFHDHVYINDEDVEIFVQGDGYYYELGVNPINTVYEIKWTWVQPLVERRDYAELDRLLRTPNFLYFLARDGEPIGRHGDLDWELPGLEHAVHIDGTLNRPEVRDRGWTVEFALPWAGLAPLMGAPADAPEARGRAADHRLPCPPHPQGMDSARTAPPDGRGASWETTTSTSPSAGTGWCSSTTRS